jgi:hypothetical protein
MTMMTAMMMTITLTMTAIMAPRIYHAFLEAEMLCLEEDLESLRELLVERNSWVLRHLGCGFTALALIWMVMTSSELEVPGPTAAAMAIYATSSLVFAVLESLLAQKIAGFLSAVPVRVKLHD